MNTNMLRLLSFQLKFSFQRLISSYYITRCLEYPFAFNSMALKQKLKVLDIGSGYSLFPVYLAYRGVETFCIDTDGSYFLNFKEVLARSKLSFLLDTKLYHMIYDGKQLPYKDEMFDRVFIISTLEHLSQQKDIELVKEIKRIVKKGGKVFISVEFHKNYREVKVPPPPCSSDDETRKQQQIELVNFLRYYDEAALLKRIIEPSGLKLIKLTYFGSKMFNIRKYLDNPNLRFFTFLSPIFAALFYKKLNGSRDFEKCSQAFPPYFSNIIACVVLEKNNYALQP